MSRISSSFVTSVSQDFSMSGNIIFIFPEVKVGERMVRIRFQSSPRAPTRLLEKALLEAGPRKTRLLKFEKSLTIICFNSFGSPTTNDGFAPRQMVNTLPYFLRKARCKRCSPPYFLVSSMFPKKGTGLGPATLNFLRSANPRVPLQ